MNTKSGITFDDLMMWRGALANCAIEGNVYAQEQLELWETDRNTFIAEYIKQTKEEVRNELSKVSSM